MAVYWLVSLAPIVVDAVCKVFCPIKMRRKALYITMFTIFAVFFALRAPTVGYDTQYYINRYEVLYKYGITRFQEIYSSEQGFTLFTLLLTRIFGSKYQYMFLISGAFIMFSYGKFLYNHSRADVLTIVLFALTLFPRSLNILRTEIAVAICLFAIDEALNGKIKRAVFIVILASTFHLSSLLYLPFIIISNPNNHISNKKRIYVLCGIIFGTSIFWNAIISNISLFNRYSVYIGEEAYYSYKISSITLYLFYISFFVIGLITEGRIQGRITASDNNLSFDDKERRDFDILFFLYLIFFLGVLVSQFVWILSRITDVFYIGYVSFIPIACDLFFSKVTKNKTSKIVELFVMILMFYIGIRAIQSNIAGCFPYEIVNIREAFF